MHLLSHLPQRPRRVQQELDGRPAQAADELRPDQLQLSLQVLRAVLRLLELGGAVLRRPALEDVADVDLLAEEAARRQDAVEQLPRGPDEWLALGVLVGPRRLADQAQLR